MQYCVLGLFLNLIELFWVSLDSLPDLIIFWGFFLEFWVLMGSFLSFALKVLILLIRSKKAASGVIGMIDLR